MSFGGGPTHNRRSTEEQIIMAIANSVATNSLGEDDVQEKIGQAVNPNVWACLQCTFINSCEAPSCAMCLLPKPGIEAPAAGPAGSFGGSGALFAAEDSGLGSGPVFKPPSSSMYGDAPPPAASQPVERRTPAQKISAHQHRRMTTEEQIALAIQQSTVQREDEGELFKRADSPKDLHEGAHRRMTTEEQIQNAIQMSNNDLGSEEFESSAGGAASKPVKTHQRMTTEEQINNAINQTGLNEEVFTGGAGGVSDEPKAQHQRMNTEDQIAAAIGQTVTTEPDEATDEDLINQAILNMGITGIGAPNIKDETMNTGVIPPQQLWNNAVEQSRGLEFVHDLISNCENYQNFELPNFKRIGVDAGFVFQRLLKVVSDKKQEINKLRLILNKERLLSRDLKYELEIMFEKNCKLEQDLQHSREAVEAAKQKAEEQAARLVEKRIDVDVEDTFEIGAAPPQERGHRQEPSYGGIRELFVDEEDAGAEPVKKAEHVREPTYGGIREMFQDVTQTPDQIAEDVQKPGKKTHEREPSYNGMTELFTRSTEEQGQVDQGGEEQAKQQQDNVGQSHESEGYGGIRDMFSESDDKVDPSEPDAEEENIKRDGRTLSYGGIREMFVEEDDQLGYSEEWEKENENQEDNFANTFATEAEVAEKKDAASYPEMVESFIDASFDLLWNLLVEKVHHPEKYLPVEDVAVEHREGKWVRHMFLAPMELVITEEISINEEDHTIKFVDNNYPDLEIVNALEKTDNENKQRILFYKQHRETGMRIANKQLVQIFTTDLHFLKFRAEQKMSRAMHSREPSYGGVASYVGTNGVALGHARDISYGGVEDSDFFPARQAPQPQQHAREMSYGGIRTMFEEQDSPQLMAKLQEEVFRVMDSYEWSQITKGMVVQEVEEVLGYKLKEHHKRFIKITIMRIIDGKLKLECFAGETVKKEVFNAERQRVVEEADKHKRDISYGGVQEMFNESGDWERKEEELDRLYSKAQERELDQLYDKAQDYSISAQAVIGGGFKAKKKILRNQEKEKVRRTQRHSRNVSYGAVHYTEPDQEPEDDQEPEVNVVKNTSITQKIQSLTEEVTGLKKVNADLTLVNENMKISKLLLAQTCSSEIERLRGIINSLS